MNFYTADITQILGIKRTRLQQWIEKGWVKPSVQRGMGSGTPNIFSRSDLYQIAIFKMLTEEMGVSREGAYNLSHDIDIDHMHEKLFGEELDDVFCLITVTDGEYDLEIWKTSVPANQLRKGKFALVLNIGKIWKEIEAKVLEALKK